MSASAASSELTRHTPQLVALDHDAQAVLSAGPCFGLVTLRLVGARGALSDRDKLGLSWIALEMVERGTKRRSRSDFHEEMNYLGAYFQTFVHRERWGLEVSALEEQLPAILELIHEAFHEASDAQEELDDILSMLEQREVQALEEPSAVASQLLGPTLWKTGAQRLNPIGNSLTRQRINRDELARCREELLAAPMTLGVAADAPEQVLPHVEGWLRRFRGTLRLPGQAPTPSRTWGRATLCYHPQAEQAAVYHAFTAPPVGSEAWTRAQLLNATFSEGFTAPLAGILRAKEGLSYVVSSAIHKHPRAPLHLFHALPQSQRAAYTLRRAREVWEAFATQKIDPEAVARARIQMLTSHTFALETARQRMSVALTEVAAGRAPEATSHRAQALRDCPDTELQSALSSFGWGSGLGNLVIVCAEATKDAELEELLAPYDVWRCEPSDLLSLPIVSDARLAGAP